FHLIKVPARTVKKIQRVVTIMFSKLRVVAGSTCNSSFALTALYTIDPSNAAKEGRELAT
ncbi:hypothetical protein L9F63_025296, partial [Diploptera punctata]